MAHKDAIGQDINPDDIVAWSPASKSAGPNFGKVTGITPKRVSLRQWYSMDDMNRRPDGGYKTSVEPKNLIVITKLM